MSHTLKLVAGTAGVHLRGTGGWVAMSWGGRKGSNLGCGAKDPRQGRHGRNIRRERIDALSFEENDVETSSEKTLLRTLLE